MDLDMTGLSIGDLSRRTGIGISTLRAWERRHGFPVAQRLPSGHRRYTEQDVEALLAVSRDRHSGSSLDGALQQARGRLGIQRSSIFATVSNALPHVSPATFSKRTMLAISRAIEDEAATRADRPTFVGAFQAPRFWRQSSDRWGNLIGRRGCAVTIAAFRQSGRRGSVYEVAAPAGTPILREWAIVCDSPTFSACLVGIEQVDTNPSSVRPRQFEALWTVEPLAVREAARTGLAIVNDLYTGLPTEIRDRLQEPVRATYDSLRVATAVTNRIVAYMESGRIASHKRPSPAPM
ncbi:MAG TPA: DICT sensory domain-containing protein [Ilumatobacteraceae bacterium]|nr:DICT sensory domain-containing protein [Ilumatobacteraceae bacterium]